MNTAKIMLGVIALSFLLLTSCSNKEIQAKYIEIPEIDSIKQIQLNSMRLDIEEQYSKEKLTSLVKDLEEAPPVNDAESKDLKRGEDYTPIGLIYKDGTKNMFYFFQKGDNWYLETEDGYFYEDAEFINDYCRNGGELNPKVVAGMPVENLKLVLELQKDFDETLDMRYFYVLGVRGNMKSQEISEEEAINFVEKDLWNDWALYRYALEQGYGFSDQKLELLINEYVEDYTNSEKYSDYRQIYETAGITVEECFEKYKEYIRAHMIMQQVYNARQKEFRDGKDTVGEKVCNNLDEYYTTFVTEVIEPEMKEKEWNNFQEKLEEARTYYSERYSK